MAKILIIDDMKGIRDSLTVILEKAGHDVVPAANGKIGLELASQSVFDLIITDILMPEVDGVEVILKLKDKANPNSTPVLAISGGGADVSAESALTLAHSFADEVMAKPFSRDDIIGAVERLTK